MNIPRTYEKHYRLAIMLLFSSKGSDPEMKTINHSKQTPCITGDNEMSLPFLFHHSFFCPSHAARIYRNSQYLLSDSRVAYCGCRIINIPSCGMAVSLSAGTDRSATTPLRCSHRSRLTLKQTSKVQRHFVDETTTSPSRLPRSRIHSPSIYPYQNILLGYGASPPCHPIRRIKRVSA